MPIDLYYLPGSAPCRAVLLTLKALGLDANLKLCDIMKGENLTPEYLKLNPTHTIPTLDDNGFSLSESRAIITYLVNQYAKDDSLYPKDAKKRAVVDQRLYFDLGTLYQRFGDYLYPVAFGGASFDPAKLEKLKEALSFLDTFIGNNNFAAGQQLTVADLSLVASVSSIELVKDIDLNSYKNISRWYANIQKVAPGYKEANGDGAASFRAWIQSLIAGKK